MPCVLTLNRLMVRSTIARAEMFFGYLTDALTRRQYWKKLATGATPEPSTQGSVLLQTWLRLHAPHNQVVLDSCVSCARLCL